MNSNQKSAAVARPGRTTAKGKAMLPSAMVEESSVNNSKARSISIGRPISSRAYAELKKKAITHALRSRKGQADSSK